MKEFNKVIRDRIPEIMDRNGTKYEIKQLDDGEYLQGLKEKLVEELEEFQEEEDITELADILEVVYAIARCKGITEVELDEIRQQKVLTNGGFHNNLFLIKTYE